MTKATQQGGPPSPEEIQKQLSEFMRQHFPAAGMASGFAPETDKTDEAPPPEEPADQFPFDYKPRDVKAHLDRYVIQQDEAKRVLSVALCDHYHHVRLALEGKETPNYAKQNIILIGPTGVGKTYLIRCIADLIGVPFVKGDATKFSETGYVGGDVEDLVRELYRRSDGDERRAQFGIIYVDEIDKIAMPLESHGARDVSGRGVQTNLLKLMEETDVPVRSAQDIAGQIQSMMEFQKGKKSASTINTKHILFIVSGAFDGLEKIIAKRLSEATIGFAAARHETVTSEDYLNEVQTKDLLEFGYEPEFVGRLPVRVICQNLEVDDLFHILKKSEGSIIRQYEQDFQAYGIEALFQDDGLMRIAELAVEEKTGARGLMTVCERVFRDFKFELPSTPVKRFVVTRSVVDSPQVELEKLLSENANQEVEVTKKLVEEYASRFAETHGLTIVFSSGAVDVLAKEALDRGESVRELCDAKFKDFQFGLKLIRQNTGRTEFEIDEKTVSDPDKVLSEWVVASYQDSD